MEVRYSITQLRSVTCHMRSHSVTCYPTQVNTPRLNPSQIGWYSIYLPRRDRRLSWPSWLDSTPAGSRTSELLITSLTPNHCTTKTTCASRRTSFKGDTKKHHRNVCNKERWQTPVSRCPRWYKYTLAQANHAIELSVRLLRRTVQHSEQKQI